MIILNVFPVHPEVQLPNYATNFAACFDLSYQPHGKFEIDGFDRVNRPFKRKINPTSGKFTIAGGERAMIPTGLIFDIPEGYSIRMHPRSGISLKRGIALINSEGVIDADYVQETFVLLWNTTDVNFELSPGDRIAQAELVPVTNALFTCLYKQPKQKTDRVGGFGSTGEGTLKTSLEKKQVLFCETLKKGRGRPKGSPNKPKEEKENGVEVINTAPDLEITVTPEGRKTYSVNLGSIPHDVDETYMNELMEMYANANTSNLAYISPLNVQNVSLESLVKELDNSNKI